jgi:hypothetical protein
LLLEVMADLVTLPLPQQAMVHGHMIGLWVYVAMRDKGLSKAEATRWVLDEMKRKIAEVQPH